MQTPRNPPLSERFASIFSMMLAMLRAQGWRALLHLPSLWLAMRMIRELGEALGALAAAFEAGTLPPIPAPQDQPAPLAYAAMPAAEPAPRGPRAPRAARPKSTPPKRQLAARPIRAPVPARRRTFARPRHPLNPPLRILVTARST
jgi:hypothetical protein